MTRDEVYALIGAERDRQAAKWAGAHAFGSGDCSSLSVDPFVKVAVLVEETGEVARACFDGAPGDLQTELVQLAAVAVAWLESM